MATSRLKIASLALLLLLVEAENILDVMKDVKQVMRNAKPWPNMKKKYDFIIVGAGSGGSAVANRLSEIGKWKILLLEAGKPEGLIQQVPVIAGYSQLSEYNWGYKVEPQANACLSMKNRRCPWPRGKSLGGTSTLNYMIHTRGSRQDYDKWAAMGNYGWSYQDVLPYFRKSEKFKVKGMTLGFRRLGLP